MISKTKRLIFVSALVFSIFASGRLRPKEVLAFDAGTQSNLASMIADKFGLKVSDVEAVFQQHRTLRQSQLSEKFAANVADAVKSGKLTEAQGKLLIAKHQELQQQRSADLEKFHSLSQSERKAYMEKRRSQLEAWAKEHGIDPKYFHVGFGGRGMHKGWGGKNL